MDQYAKNKYTENPYTAIPTLPSGDEWSKFVKDKQNQYSQYSTDRLSEMISKAVTHATEELVQMIKDLQEQIEELWEAVSDED
jgi:gas vesicle protein